MLTVYEVIDGVKRALLTHRPLSLIRLGNGEALAMAHQTLVPTEQIPAWIGYAGAHLPDENLRQALRAAVKTADIVGLSTDRDNWDCAPLLDRVLIHYRLQPKTLTHARINWELHERDRIYHLLQRVPTIIVGRLAERAAPILRAKGVSVW